MADGVKGAYGVPLDARDKPPCDQPHCGRRATAEVFDSRGISYGYLCAPHGLRWVEKLDEHEKWMGRNA